MSGEIYETRPLNPGLLAGVRLAPGVVLRDRYRLEAEVGRGAMGVVFRATDLQLQREVAVKLLPEAASDPEARTRLLREARAAAALNHPRVVAVHDVGEDRGVPFFVMELVEGSILGHAALPDLRRVVDLGRQICEALEHAHAHGLVHRDLKPENVLLAGAHEPRSVKLADLGLAVPARGEAGLASVAGTVAYMAPEQALGRPVDGRADLYSLGVMLYEMSTGRLPFTGDDALSLVSQHVQAPVVPPRAFRSELPVALEEVILRLLAKEPEQRFESAHAARLALEEVWTAPTAAAGDESAAAVALLNALSRGRLVGRTEELSEARTLWRRAMTGQGHCVLLSGEPGAGKTRLARELLVQAAVDGAVVLSGACYEYEATTPYLPFVEAFRRWIQDRPDAELAAAVGTSGPWLAKLVPELESRLGPFPDRPPVPPHEERLLFFDAVARVAQAMARQSGLLLYIDDLHWADSSTLWLFGYLLRNLREARALFLASYREVELDRAHPLAKALVDWNRERLTTRIVLRRFGLPETHAQLAALLGENVPLDFAQAVYRETEGNPFFVEEVLKSLIEQGAVRREQGRWVQEELSSLVIPQSVKAAIGSRLDRVSEVGNEVLRAAAVLGKTFSFDELKAAASERGEDALLDALDEAVRAQLVIAQDEESFAFTHDKVREVLYEEMNPIRRRRLHRRTAEGLESLRPRVAVPVETLAHHYVEAGDYERGLGYAKEAAGEAERVYAFHEAIVAYSRALECAEALQRPQERAVLEESIGVASIAVGDFIPAAGHFERALALTHDPGDRVRLQCRAASSYVTTGDERGLGFVKEALAVLDPEKDPINTASALSIEARFHHLSGRHRRAVELLERAAALGAPSSDATQIGMLQASVLSPIYAYLAGAHQQLGLFEDADRWARTGIAFGERFGIPVAQAAGYEFLGEDAISSGDWHEGIGYAEKERGIAARIHSRERQAWTALVVGLCTYCLGDRERAEREFVEGIALADLIGERRLATLLLSFLAMVQADAGRDDEALATAEDGLRRAEELGLFHMRAEARRALAHVRARRGETEDALRIMDDVLEFTSGSESVVTRLWMGPLHVETLLRAERASEARKQLADYATLVGRCQSAHFRREATRLEALVSTAGA